MDTSKFKAWRKMFDFDFNEDAEPVSEIHRMRRAFAKRFKTREEQKAYYDAVPSVAEMIAGLDEEIAAEKRQAKKTAAKPSRRITSASKPRRRAVKAG